MKPTFRFNSVMDISIPFLKEQNIKLIIFDADSTLIKAKNHFIDNDIMTKVDSFTKNGFETIIASNGKTHRIDKVFKGHNIKAYGMSLKPFPFKLSKIVKNYNKNEVVLVGDQYFTDIICANLIGIKSIMVRPYGGDSGNFMKFKRYLEKIILGD